MKSKKSRVWQSRLVRINEKPAPLTPEERKKVMNVDNPRGVPDYRPCGFGLRKVNGVWREDYVD